MCTGCKSFILGYVNFNRCLYLQRRADEKNLNLVTNVRNEEKKREKGVVLPGSTRLNPERGGGSFGVGGGVVAIRHFKKLFLI